jgi:NAD+ synthase (glutamine-hydrolysing)
MNIAIAQLNPMVGDIQGNIARLEQAMDRLKVNQPALTIFPELYLTGYPPRDLLDRPAFIAEAEKGLEEICRLSRKIPNQGILFGTVVRDAEPGSRKLFNAAVLVQNGRQLFTQKKSLLPVYDVFDERRYFEPAPEVHTFDFQGECLGISICEDAWNDPEMRESPAYPFDPIEILAEKKATLMINISASPYQLGKDRLRHEIIGYHARRHQLPFVLVNQVGGNDELIFDGHSFAMNSRGTITMAAGGFEEQVECFSLTGLTAVKRKNASQQRPAAEEHDDLDNIHQALVLGVKDYCRKCGFRQTLVGLSGGIDSALVSCLAVEALGRENVWGIGMPSSFSSSGSISDARKLAENLGIRFDLIPISTLYNQYLEALSPLFAGRNADVTEENIQARIRGTLLMALSNKFGHLLLTTGNKSELAVGYCTLYGDMCGGLGVISDLPKTMVYRLAERLNKTTEIIPREIIHKAPSAELRPDQKDQDTLPPYEILDQVLSDVIDQGLSAAEIIDKGFDPETVHWITKAVRRNEYKRRQAAPGLKITSKAFGMGRRMPIAARYKL